MSIFLSFLLFCGSFAGRGACRGGRDHRSDAQGGRTARWQERRVWQELEGVEQGPWPGAGAQGQGALHADAGGFDGAEQRPRLAGAAAGACPRVRGGGERHARRQP